METFEKPEEKKYEELLELYEGYFKPRKDTIYERFQFFQQRQQAHQTVNDLVLELRSAAAACEFEAHERENLIRDMLVIGVTNQVNEELLQITDLKLENAIAKCRLAETSGLEAISITGGNQSNVVNVENVDSVRKGKQAGFHEGGNKCGKCNYVHERGRCFAFGKTR